MKRGRLFDSKMTMRRFWGWLAAAFLMTHFSFLISCTSIDCPVQNTVSTVYNLMKADGTPDTLLKDTLWVWTVRANGTDTVISRRSENNLELNYFNGSSAYTFQLPISHTQPEDVLYMLLRDADNKTYIDTVRIKKEDQPHFESVDCQAVYFHTLTAVMTTHHFIDSIVIKNPVVTYDATNPHFYLYLKTDR